MSAPPAASVAAAHRFEKCLELDPVSLRESFHEVAVSLGTRRLPSRLDRSQWSAIVPTHCHAVLQAEELHAHVVSARIVSCRREDARGAALEPQRGTCRIDVFVPGEQLIVGFAVRVYLYDSLPEHPCRNIEIMDREVAPDPA